MKDKETLILVYYNSGSVSAAVAFLQALGYKEANAVPMLQEA